MYETDFRKERRKEDPVQGAILVTQKRNELVWRNRKERPEFLVFLEWEYSLFGD